MTAHDAIGASGNGHVEARLTPSVFQRGLRSTWAASLHRLRNQGRAACLLYLEVLDGHLDGRFGVGCLDPPEVRGLACGSSDPPLAERLLGSRGFRPSNQRPLAAADHAATDDLLFHAHTDRYERCRAWLKINNPKSPLVRHTWKRGDKALRCDRILRSPSGRPSAPDARLPATQQGKDIGEELLRITTERVYEPFASSFCARFFVASNSA